MRTMSTRFTRTIRQVILCVWLLGQCAHAENIIVNGQVFADNFFKLWVNGKLVATDPIEFTPHNVVGVKLAEDYPIVYAIKAVDFAHPQTGLEYNHTRIGDGGLIAKFSDGTVTGPHWRCRKFSWGPVDRSCLQQVPERDCQVKNDPIPENWIAQGFDDSGWKQTVIHSESAVRPHGDYYDYDWKGAEFIWTSDLEIDNVVLCRLRVEKPNSQ